jgi:hypothetical protein
LTDPIGGTKQFEFSSLDFGFVSVRALLRRSFLTSPFGKLGFELEEIKRLGSDTEPLVYPLYTDR